MAGIFTRSRARCTPTRKSLPVELSVCRCVCVIYLTYVFLVHAHACPTCVKRDVATQAVECSLGTCESPTRRARPSCRFPLSFPLPRVLSSLQEETRTKGGDGYQEGTRWNSPGRIFPPFLHAGFHPPRLFLPPAFVHARRALFARIFTVLQRKSSFFFQFIIMCTAARVVILITKYTRNHGSVKKLIV